MKKGKKTTGIVALLIATIMAIAFKTVNNVPVDLYYFNNNNSCVAAPCETINITNKACLITVYSDSNCRFVYKGIIWATKADQ